jgi:hypothetical protein
MVITLINILLELSSTLECSSIFGVFIKVLYKNERKIALWVKSCKYYSKIREKIAFKSLKYMINNSI